jgi:hypothetical protein
MANASSSDRNAPRAALLKDGYAAAARGLKRKDNPYPVPSFEASAWECGWADHRKKHPAGKRRSRPD